MAAGPKNSCRGPCFRDSVPYCGHPLKHQAAMGLSILIAPLENNFLSAY